MTRTLKYAGFLLSTLMLAGCMTTGLSLHETTPGMGRGSGDFARTLYALATPTGPLPTGPVTVRRPLTLALVQLGEIAPPQRMVVRLQQHPDLES